MKCATLREANIARDKEWTGGLGVGPLWRPVELCGEAAELYEAVRTLTFAESREEVGDVAICLDLAALDLGMPTPRPYSSTSLMPHNMGDLAALVMQRCGQHANECKKLEREARGWVGSRSTKARAHLYLEQAASALARLAFLLGGVDLDELTRSKFNATSEKYGLTTRIVDPRPRA